MDSRYVDGFSDWADVQVNFRTKEPEPDEVIIAHYDLDQAYEGSALVIYRNGTTYYTVEGSHCSCYGLENQWETSESSLELLKAEYERIAGQERGYGINYRNAKVILERLNG